jgi:hypothetical protein
VLVPRSSGTPVATWAWPTWVVSQRRVLEAVFILFEFPFTLPSLVSFRTDSQEMLKVLLEMT